MLDGRTDPAMALIFARSSETEDAGRGEPLGPLGGAGIWAGLAALFSVFTPTGAAEPVPVTAAATCARTGQAQGRG